MAWILKQERPHSCRLPGVEVDSLTIRPDDAVRSVRIYGGNLVHGDVYQCDECNQLWRYVDSAQYWTKAGWYTRYKLYKKGVRFDG